jgi:tetraacyldisaccharide 4'-kinase
VYAAAAGLRRGYYQRRPHLQRRLRRPVISIGNVAVGGRAKTPLAALVAARLREMGERPAILSRGYARRDARDGVVVVRDPDGIRADLDRAGDEPLMLARRLDGIAVLASASRYLAGRLAEHHFSCTVHVLDDGFQHFALYRDRDLVVIGREDLEDPRTLPSGRLREPLDAVAAADAIVSLDDAPVDTLAHGRPVWRARRRQEPARIAGGARVDPSSGPVVAVAGIANPRRFFGEISASGWTIAREMPFRDHHLYSRRDIGGIIDAARTSGARLVLTTEKDLVRLLPFRPFAVPVAYVPVGLEIEPAETFDAWLAAAMEDPRG